MVARLGDAVTFYKVGMELAYAPDGFAFARDLVASGKRLFIDLKLHDIGPRWSGATRQSPASARRSSTVHAIRRRWRRHAVASATAAWPCSRSR